MAFIAGFLVRLFFSSQLLQGGIGDRRRDVSGHVANGGCLLYISIFLWRVLFQFPNEDGVMNAGAINRLAVRLFQPKERRVVNARANLGVSRNGLPVRYDR